jgi:hypothetical protein
MQAGQERQEEKERLNRHEKKERLYASCGQPNTVTSRADTRRVPAPVSTIL